MLSRAVHIKDEYMWVQLQSTEDFPQNLFLKSNVPLNIPVITVGRFTEPQYAELLVREGRADLVAFGRQSLADPEMPNKAKEERLEDMIPCIACLRLCSEHVSGQTAPLSYKPVSWT